MREVLTISIGQAGIQLGEAVWQQYCVEHGINIIGTKPKTEDTSYLSFFQQTKDGLHIPRNLMVDSEPNIIDAIRCSKYRQIYNPQYLLSGHEDAANNFARGYYSIGSELIEIINDRLRKLVDNCDNFEGVLINRSVGGGTGSGLGSLILEQIGINYKKKLKIGFEIYTYVSETCVVEPYNAMLATHWLLDHTDISIVLDNEAIYEINQKWLDIRRPMYGDLNNLVRKAISSITTSLRFEGAINACLNEMQKNLVAFPRLHMMITSIAPVTSPRKWCCQRSDVQSITESCFCAQNIFTKIGDFDSEEDKYMAICVNYHGDIRTKEAMATTQWLKRNKKVTFVEWCPTATNFNIVLNEKAIATLEDDHLSKERRFVSMIGNNTAISRVVSERISKKYDLMYSQKAFVHWYNSEGMEDKELEEARDDLGFLERDYLDVLYESTTSEMESNSD